MTTETERTSAEIERRGYVWRCSDASLKKTSYRQIREARTVNGKDIKADLRPCFKWNAYFGRKWATSKGQPRWMARCKYCQRQRQLNLGNIKPEGANYYRTKVIAERNAQEKNDRQDRKKDGEWGPQ